jgi:oligopeptide/dipeptide ABC transporter ATP-binding protein
VADTALLTVDHLQVDLRMRRELRRVIHDVSLTVAPGESLGIVGESGSGKSMTVRSIVRILPERAVVKGEVTFAGKSILSMSPAELRNFRANEVGMIYQDPRAHVNPLRTIGDFLTEGLRLTAGVSRDDATRRAVSLLKAVGIDNAGERLRQYPHQLSGGLLQRVMIASALLTEPRLLIADEPTTALDVTTQEEVMAILDELRQERGLALIFITHNLDLAAAVTDQLAVMYAGVVVEKGPSSELQHAAQHPYTVGLLSSRPSIVKTDRLQAIPGRPVSAFEAGEGCVFSSRCPFAQERCEQVRPELRTLGEWTVACHRAEEVESLRKDLVITA